MVTGCRVARPSSIRSREKVGGPSALRIQERRPLRTKVRRGVAGHPSARRAAARGSDVRPRVAPASSKYTRGAGGWALRSTAYAVA